jgi:ATP-dependent RNA helicase DDX54/DBP10
MSENEVDIAGSLFANDADSDNEVQVHKQQQPADLDFGDLLDNGDGSDDGGDAAFIAKQQRSSNRKTGNLQGKSAKKGGGFQAMGECRDLALTGGLWHMSNFN